MAQPVAQSSSARRSGPDAPKGASTPGRQGRPKDTAKHAAIIAAARLLFSRMAFELVTMEAVAAHANVSKMTIYSHFRDKETLFETIVYDTSDQMLGAVSPQDDGGDLQIRLATVGRAFLDVILGSEVCNITYSLTGTLRGNRPLAERFYAAGPGRVRAALSAMIAAAGARGELMVDDPDLAADDLVSLWEGVMPTRLAFGLVSRASAEEIARRADRGTQVFLRAYRPALPR